MKVLITGASGSFGSAFIRHLVQEGHEKIVAYSRNEAAQARLRESIFPSNVTWMLGDVRDTERLYDSMHRIDTIVHAAALKRVDDNDPMELYATNIQGTINVVRAAIKRNVPRVLVLSTDKACAPATAYGASKLAAEFYAVYANKWGKPQTRISCSRWGNVLNSAGSVVPTWRRQLQRCEPVTITDGLATRFLLTMDEAVAYTRRFLDRMHGGEIFIPELRGCTIGDLATAVCGQAKRVGMAPRAGEKRHEVLISGDESVRTYYIKAGGYFVLTGPGYDGVHGGQQLSLGVELNSADAPRLTVADLHAMLS